MADLHKQPTADELQAGIDKSLKDLEKLDTPPKDIPPPAPDDKKVDPPVKTPEEIEAERKAKEEADKKAKEEADKKPDDKKPEDVDYKKKFIESQKESMRLYKTSVEVDKAVEEANKIAEPTDDEMKILYKDFELMTDTEKRLTKDNELNKKRFALISNASKVTKDIQAWNEKVDKFVTDPVNLTKYPELEGKEDDFKLYATDKAGVGSNFEILVDAFLHVIAKATTPKKGKMFETGSGGPSDKPKPKSDKISLTEARIMMKSDYKKYKEMLLAGKIDLSDI